MTISLWAWNKQIYVVQVWNMHTAYQSVRPKQLHKPMSLKHAYCLPACKTKTDTQAYDLWAWNMHTAYQSVRKPSSSHSISTPTNINTQFLQQSLCVCFSI